MSVVLRHVGLPEPNPLLHTRWVRPRERQQIGILHTLRVRQRGNGEGRPGRQTELSTPSDQTGLPARGRFTLAAGNCVFARHSCESRTPAFAGVTAGLSGMSSLGTDKLLSPQITSSGTNPSEMYLRASDLCLGTIKQHDTGWWIFPNQTIVLVSANRLGRKSASAQVCSAACATSAAASSTRCCTQVSISARRVRKLNTHTRPRKRSPTWAPVSITLPRRVTRSMSSRVA